jgi:hypothetical protein
MYNLQPKKSKQSRSPKWRVGLENISPHADYCRHGEVAIAIANTD